MINEENPRSISLNDSFFKKNFKKLIITGCIIGSAFFIQEINFNQEKIVIQSEKIADNSKELDLFKKDMIDGKYNSKEISEIIKNHNELISFTSESTIPIIKKGYNIYTDMDESVVFDYNNNGKEIKILKKDLKSYACGEEISPLKEKAINI
jgi:hypothetical protein